MKKILPIIIIVLIITGLGVVWKMTKPNQGDGLEKADLVRVNSPRPGEVVSSPLTITGQARGTWFFEASFPVYITNWDGLIIGQGIATAKEDPNAADGAGWMTTEFVPFEAAITFVVDKNAYSNRGTLILKKDNPSELPEHDDALEIPVLF
ncbi:MAG: Gmad2 immunoglobulin-like domain-containing protein [Candidatus Vogelbacteria bacterium]